MGQISVSLPADGETIDASDYNTPINTIVNEINGELDNSNIASDAAIAGTKLADDTIPPDKMTEEAHPETRYADSFFDHVASGCVWSADSAGSTLAGSMTAGVVYINGERVSVSAVSAHSFTASKDTYVDVDNTGTLTYTEKTNNAASPTLGDNSIRLAIIVSGASSIADAGSINQGQEDKILPIASSVAYAVTDSLGNLICPRDPNRKILGFRRRTSNVTTTSSGSNVQITGLSVPVIVPSGRKVRITLFTRSLQHTVASTTISMTIWDGTVGSGTKLAEAYTTIPTANGVDTVTCQTVVTPSATSKTYNAGFKMDSAGTGTVTGGSELPAFMSVELV